MVPRRYPAKLVSWLLRKYNSVQARICLSFSEMGAMISMLRMQIVTFVDCVNDAFNIGVHIYNSERDRDFPNLHKFSLTLGKNFYTIKY